MRNTLRSLVILLCLALLAPGPVPAQEAEPGATSELRPWEIGVIMPLSGALAAYGESTLDGIEMAVETINARGGVAGRTIGLIVENNEGDKSKSAAAFRKLAGLNRVLAVIGPITSTNALAVTPDAQRKGIVLLTPTGTNDRITADGDFIFRTCFNDSFQGIAVAKFARDELGAQTGGVFRDTQSDYSVGLCQSFAETFAELGGEMTEAQSYKTGDTDFTAQLRKVRRNKPDVFFIPGYPPELPLIVNQSRALRIDTVLLGADGWDNDDLIDNSGDKLDGSYFSAAFSPDAENPELKAFLAQAAARGIDNPGSFEALGYDSLGLIARALERVTYDAELQARRQALRDALAAVQNFQGATGSITMQPSGDPLKSLVIMQFVWQDGKVHKKLVKTMEP